MKKIFTRYYLALLLCLGIGSLVWAGENFSVQYQKLYDAGDFQSALGECKKWEKAEPNDPEAYINEGNCYLGMGYTPASDLAIGQEPPPDFSREDPTLFNETRQYNPEGKCDPTQFDQAIKVLETAVAKFPNRLDIWFGISYLHQMLDDFDRQYGLLCRFLVWSKGHQRELRWSKGGPLPKPAGRYIPECMQDYAQHYLYDVKKPRWDYYLKIAQLIALYYPQYPDSFDKMGNYFMAQGDWKAAKEYYLVAFKLAPKNSLILVHLGNLYTKTKDEGKAKEFYQKVIQLDKNADDVLFSKKCLIGSKI